MLREWYSPHTFYKARSAREASLIVANSSAPVDAVPAYLLDRARSGLAMPMVDVSPYQHHGQPSDDVGDGGRAEVGPVAVGGVVTVYAIEELNAEVFVELMKVICITG